MQLKLNKTELAGALAALGKLISRTAPVEASRAVEITGFADTLYFRTRNAFEEIEFTMFAEMDEDFPATLVNFEQFRLAVRNCKNKTLKLEVDSGKVVIEDARMAPVNGHFPLKEKIQEQNACMTELPADTLSALSMLAPLTDRTNSRKVLGGINISGDGFTAANDKELLNIPLSLEMTGSVTIPFPLTLIATKAFGESGKLTTWQKDEDTHFELTLGNWTWRAKAFKENYLLDFINIDNLGELDKDLDERVIENEIVKNIRDFIIRFGTDFIFMGNQYRIEISEEEMFIDLL